MTSELSELTVRDLMTRTDLPVRTAGYASPGDGGALDWAVTAGELVGRVDPRLAVPMADGRWAMPIGLPELGTLPPAPAYVARDVLGRARTFVDAPAGLLQWNASKPGPLAGATPAAWGEPPFPITCSHLVGMLMCGWELATTTYVAAENTATGWVVDGLADPPETTGIWWAQRLAKWCHGRGLLARADEDPTVGLYLGDILFFSEQDPERSYPLVRAYRREPYFGNVYHVALYVGDGRVIHSTGPATSTAVYEAPLGALAQALTLVARPRWRLPR